MKLNDLYTAEIHDDGAEVNIKDGEGNNTKLFIKVRGVDSKAVRKHNKRQQKAYIECLRKDQEFDDDKWLIDGLVSATIGWRGITEKYDEKLCKELYENAPYVREQVDEFIADRANFTKAKRKK